MSKTTSSRSSTRSSSRSSARTSSPTAPTQAAGFARARATKKPANPAVAAAGAPWVKDGIDYGPARAAFDELARWVLDLAEREVDGDRADTKRIRKVRRAFGKGGTGHVPFNDAVFVAQILARVFDRDLGLALADQLEIFDQLDLDTDALPLWAPRPRPALSRATLAPTQRPTAPSIERGPIPLVRIRVEATRPDGLMAPTRPIQASTTARMPTHVAPPPLRFCDECGYVHEPGEHVFQRRNAA